MEARKSHNIVCFSESFHEQLLLRSDYLQSPASDSKQVKLPFTIKCQLKMAMYRQLSLAKKKYDYLQSTVISEKTYDYLQSTVISEKTYDYLQSTVAKKR